MIMPGQTLEVLRVYASPHAAAQDAGTVAEIAIASGCAPSTAKSYRNGQRPIPVQVLQAVLDSQGGGETAAMVVGAVVVFRAVEGASNG